MNQNPGSYAAAPATIFERFDAANLARRCELATDEECSLVYFLQSIVLAEKGLTRFVAEFKSAFPDAIAIPSLGKMRTDSEGMLNAAQVQVLRSEIKSGDFPLGDEYTDADLLDQILGRDDDEGYQFARSRRKNHPQRYHKSAFLAAITEAWDELENGLIDFCADAELARNISRRWWWSCAQKALLQYKSFLTEQRRRAFCQTSISRIVHQTLDRCAETGNLVMIDGDARTGKTFAVKNWCEIHPGEACYVQTPCTPNEPSFLIEIAKAAGIPATVSTNLGKLRAKIESTFQASKRPIIFDEAHSLLPSTRYTKPGRLQWILTALVNHRVPVALVTTPQFLKAQEELATRTTWNLAQFVGRIFIHARLPSKLPREELIVIARHLFPAASDGAVRAIAGYAESVPAYTQGIGFILDESRCVARRAGRDHSNDSDIQSALKTLIGSGTAIAERLQSTRRPSAMDSAPAHAKDFSASRIGGRIQQSASETVGA